MLVRALLLHVRRPFTGNGVAPPRPLPLLAIGRISFLSDEPRLAQRVFLLLLVVLDRPFTVGDLAAGGNTPEAELPAVSRPGRGLFVRRNLLLGTQVQNIQTPPPLVYLLFHVCVFSAL
jgi:hypothetical protein